MHAEMHKLRQIITEERQKAVERQQVMFEMLKEVQRMSIQQTVTSAKVLENVESQFANLHKRCIPEYVQKDLDKGIAAMKHRQDRRQIEEKENVDRCTAEKMMISERLADLDVWENHVTSPTPAVTKSNSSRERRAITRAITKTLQQANKECEDAENPLTKMTSIVKKTRDANAEVNYCGFRIGTISISHRLLCVMHYMHSHILTQEMQYLVDQAKKVKERKGVLTVSYIQFVQHTQTRTHNYTVG